MKTTISNNKYYSISIDKEKQRLYVKLQGAWHHPKSFPNYVLDVEKSVRNFEGNFTFLADFSSLKPYSKDVWDQIQAVALKKVVSSGMKETAQIMPDNYSTSDMIEMDGKALGFQLNAFGDEEIAELFLDSAQ